MVGTLEEFVEAMPKKPPQLPDEPPLDDSDLAIIGRNSVRLDIPFTNSLKSRKAADLLAGLATRLQAISRRVDITERERLFLMANITRDVRDRIRLLSKNLNKNGTIRKE